MSCKPTNLRPARSFSSQTTYKFLSSQQLLGTQGDISLKFLQETISVRLWALYFSFVRSFPQVNNHRVIVSLFAHSLLRRAPLFCFGSRGWENGERTGSDSDGNSTPRLSFLLFLFSDSSRSVKPLQNELSLEEASSFSSVQFIYTCI